MTIEFEGEDTSPEENRGRVFGSLGTFDAEVPDAVYIVEFPFTKCGNPTRKDRATLIDVLLGKWGEGTEPYDRSIYRIFFFLDPERFQVADAQPRPALAITALSREEAFALGKIKLIFRILDAIWEQDTRIPWENAGDGRTQN